MWNPAACSSTPPLIPAQACAVFTPDRATALICGIGAWHAQEYRGRLPAVESWRRYQAGRDADSRDEDGGLAWVDGATAALQSVRPDGVQSGEQPDRPRPLQSW